MLLTTIRSPPSAGDYTPLSEYQSQTPESFVGGKPVLYYHVAGAKAWVPKAQCGSLATFPADSSAPPSAPESEGLDGEGEQLVEQKVDIFVNSENFTIFSPHVEAGVSIPYPSISIHALKQVGPESNRSPAVWMQLELDGGSDDEDFNTVELTIIPPTTDSTPNAASKFYEALAACSDLHPDPNDGDEDEEEDYDRIVFEGSAEYEALEGFPGVLRGGNDASLPPPMPGSGGWITAENVDQFFDEEGNWLGRGNQQEEELGEGAGRVRAREETEGEGVNGHDSADPENKRPRVD
ncbi:Fc.00g048660.m01.CDS01 [Cosmosporella sp. VM-42]